MVYMERVLVRYNVSQALFRDRWRSDGVHGQLAVRYPGPMAAKQAVIIPPDCPTNRPWSGAPCRIVPHRVTIVIEKVVDQSKNI